ncbi:MAG TPA: sulfotransferase [Chitinophagales bacterium]|nr:sulfotransferase [Chitinophagales bacterium]HQW78425.1 sulfotransferase [Chitinophagales bacterium]HRB68164.1 sulfotransferase [Chitinophagales bacterium]HRB69570.1 sulfotransferase [Chitinophagales bacterium]
MAFQERIIFIVGNSRSGTTMMLRIFNNHSQLMVLNELHFFEQLWSPSDKGKIISPHQAVELASKLMLTQRIGYMTHDQDYIQFNAEASNFVHKINSSNLTAEYVFNEFTKYEVALNNKSIVCEKTPQNVFYLKEILELYPKAKIINMVRDPRAILLSQKNKWNRRNLGGNYMTRKEALRLRINYHPITLSQLWNAAINAGNSLENEPRIISIRFEDLLEQPQSTIEIICQHIEVEFDSNMLNITQESSSIEKDSKEIGFKKERASNWKKGGLNSSERWICQQQCSKNLSLYHYPIENISPNYLYLAFYFISFPIKLGIAFLMNLNRMKNIAETLKRRLK